MSLSEVDLEQVFVLIAAPIEADGSLALPTEHKMVPVKCIVEALPQACKMVEENGVKVIAILPKVVALGLPQTIADFEAMFEQEREQALQQPG